MRVLAIIGVGFREKEVARDTIPLANVVYIIIVVLRELVIAVLGRVFYSVNETRPCTLHTISPYFQNVKTFHQINYAILIKLII